MVADKVCANMTEVKSYLLTEAQKLVAGEVKLVRIVHTNNNEQTMQPHLRYSGYLTVNYDGAYSWLGLANNFLPCLFIYSNSQWYVSRVLLENNLTSNKGSTSTTQILNANESRVIWERAAYQRSLGSHSSLESLENAMSAAASDISSGGVLHVQFFCSVSPFTNTHLYFGTMYVYNPMWVVVQLYNSMNSPLEIIAYRQDNLTTRGQWYYSTRN